MATRKRKAPATPPRAKTANVAWQVRLERVEGAPRCYSVTVGGMAWGTIERTAGVKFKWLDGEAPADFSIESEAGKLLTAAIEWALTPAGNGTS